ncbi:MAG: hypothetical protein ACYDDI_14360 [Candidatus Acidiferrales bacterium]
MKTFTELKNAQSIAIAYDGLNPGDSDEGDQGSGLMVISVPGLM